MNQRKNKSDEQEHSFFNRLALVTLIAVYILIIVGGIVRSTGSGMGCPDWPKCFGQWVPPTEEAELPADYKEKFTAKRLAKNERLANYLLFLGMEEKAEQVVHDDLVKEEQEFNKYKTWTEYINRLVGVTIGILVMATFIASIRFFKSKPALFWVALAMLLLTGFQGWLGSLVVSTNLLPWMVTVHMLISFVIVAGLIYMVYESSRKKNEEILRIPDYSLIILALCIVSLIVQVVFGTQVRESIDEVALSLQYTMRDTWISRLDWQFYFHRSFSWAIMILHIGLLVVLLKAGIRNWSIALLASIVLAIITGTALSYLAIPAVLQPVHLVLSVVIFGIQYYIFLLLRNRIKQIGVAKG